MDQRRLGDELGKLEEFLVVWVKGDDELDLQFISLDFLEEFIVRGKVVFSRQFLHFPPKYVENDTFSVELFYFLEFIGLV